MKKIKKYLQDWRNAITEAEERILPFRMLSANAFNEAEKAKIELTLQNMASAGFFVLNHKWEDEKDIYIFKYKGLQCLILRQEHFGTLNGYVEIPFEHKFYGKDYTGEIEDTLSVHGGITYAGNYLNFEFDNVGWWVGFDTIHSGDISPKIDKKLDDHHNGNWEVSYKDYEYVKNQIESLVEQILKIN